MRVVAIVNQKGGCGKTTTAINLAAVMARDGVRSLLVDMDPQSHCAAGLGVPDQRIERTIGDAMLAENPAALSVDEFVWEVGRNLHLAPSSVTLSLLEAPNGPLTARFDRDRRLARVLAAWKDRFDWCVIDCPPTIGLLTFNALRAADLVIIPVETGYFSLKGAEKQIQTIEAVVGRFGRDIPFRLLPTLVNERRALSRDVVEALARRCPWSSTSTRNCVTRPASGSRSPSLPPVPRRSPTSMRLPTGCVNTRHPRVFSMILPATACLRSKHLLLVQARQSTQLRRSRHQRFNLSTRRKCSASPRAAVQPMSSPDCGR